MLRPMALAGFTLLLTNLMCLVFGSSFAIATGTVVLFLLCFALLIHKWIPNSRQVTALFGCLLFVVCGCFTFWLSHAMYIQPINTSQPTQRSVTFTVTQKGQVYGDTRYYTIRAEDLYPDSNNTGLIRLRASYDCDLQPGDKATGKIALSAPSSSRRIQDYSNGIYATGDLLSYEKKEGTHWLYRLCDLANEHCQNLFGQCGEPQAAALIKGICLGDVSGLSTRNSQNLSDSGMRHLVAVSGLHTNTLGGVLVGAFLFLGSRKRWAKLSAIVPVWLFALLTGLSYSSLRAAIMFTVYAVMHLWFLKADPLNNLGLAVTVILLGNPFTAGNVGFLASVLCCVGILVLFEPLYGFLLSRLPQKLQKMGFVKAVLAAMCVSLTANVGLIPCNILSFKTFSLASPLVNLIAVPVTGFILCGGLAAALLSLIPGFSFIVNIMLTALRLLATLVLTLGKWVSSCRFLLLQQASPFFCLCAFLVLVAGILCYVFRQKLRTHQKTLIALLLVVVMLTGSLVPVYPANTYEVVFITNGYQLSVAVVGNRETVVIGCHDAYSVCQVLKERGANRIDLLVVPQGKYYQDQLTQLDESMPIQTLMASPQFAISGFASALANTRQVVSPSRLTLGNVTVTQQEAFQAFTVNLAGHTLQYLQDQSQVNSQTGYTVVDCYSYDTQGFLLTSENGAFKQYDLSETTVLRLSPTRSRIYRPRRLL